MRRGNVVRMSIELKLLPVVFTPGRLNISFKSAAFTLVQQFREAAKYIWCRTLLVSRQSRKVLGEAPYNKH